MVRLPADEGQLRSMLAQGLLDEWHSLELKRELPPGTAANKELAKDLAQFTIDSGTLIIGVDEGDETTPPSLTPVALAGLPERIEEVAANRVDPPLHVRIQTIPAAGQPGQGYLLVIVPPTPSKIHMVDGRYWARGERTRYALSDAEVQRYHQLVLKGQRDAADLIDVEVRRDPAAEAGLTAHAHLFGMAQPVGARPDLLERVIGGSGPRGWHDFLHGQVRSGSAGRPLTNGWSPDLPGIGEPSRRARGWAISSPSIRPGRTVEVPGPDPLLHNVDVEKRLLDLEVNEDGGLRLFCGRASRHPARRCGVRDRGPGHRAHQAPGPGRRDHRHHHRLARELGLRHRRHRPPWPAVPAPTPAGAGLAGRAVLRGRVPADGAGHLRAGGQGPRRHRHRPHGAAEPGAGRVGPDPAVVNCQVTW
jgi:hypothetical protein